MGTFHPDLWAETGFATPGSDPDAFFDPFALIGALGQKTSIPFGIGVTDTMRRGAADLARSALTLHHLCRGGFKLGIGSGERENLVPFGYSFEKPVGRCEEVLGALRSLLDGGRFPGTHGRIGLPRESEAGRPEIWVAGHKPRMLRLTGQFGDGWFPAWAMTPEEYGEKRETIARHADAAGRPAPESGFQPFTILGESLERLEEQFEQEPLGKLFALFAHGEVWARHGLEHPLGEECQGIVDVVVHDLDAQRLRELAPRIPFSLMRDIVIMGGPEEIAAQLEPFAREGAEHIILANMTGIVGGADEFMARLADFPRLGAAIREL
jgi:phthiodiolone/phenolphthiodiolone dimycocerosates ketoreductase